MTQTMHGAGHVSLEVPSDGLIPFHRLVHGRLRVLGVTPGDARAFFSQHHEVIS